MCVYQTSLCEVYLVGNTVESWDNFNPIFTDDLR